MAIRVVCETTELAVECLQIGQALALPIAPVVPDGDWLEAATAGDDPGPLGIALRAVPELAELVRLAEAHQKSGRVVALASVANGETHRRMAGAGSDLGLCVVDEVEPLIACLSLLHAGVTTPWTASTRSLPSVDRERLREATRSPARNQGELIRVDALGVGFRVRPGEAPIALGRARDAATAIAALHARDGLGQRVTTVVDDVDRQQVLDVLFGPARALSDPASKAALSPYGLPMPEEELCASPSRAAAEAARLGFPVRIALASPDLRIWDHPDLALDMVDSAAAVRNTFRQLTALAKTRARAATGGREPRLLGVTVTAASAARALIGVRCTPLPHARVATEIAFADDHGRAARDAIDTVLPVAEDQFERVLRRLSGHALLLDGSATQRQERIGALANVLLRTAAFVTDYGEHVSSVELRPAALLVDNTVEVREACVTVNERFERNLINAG